LYERLIAVQGTVVSSSEIAGATITHNMESRLLELTFEGEGSYNYSFDTAIELLQGWNTITVSAIDSDGWSGNDTVVVFADIAGCAIRIELTWNTTDTDLDSHLIAPGHQFGDEYWDCYFADENPDWDDTGDSSDGDPALDVDDTDGYGPEHIVLCVPPFNGVYIYKVHYFSDHGHGVSTATVKIWIDEVLVFTASRSLSDDEVWDCACIAWPSGIVSAGPCPG
jgi:uncharacterized protein YfaP (DUF2135 family)